MGQGTLDTTGADGVEKNGEKEGSRVAVEALLFFSVALLILMASLLVIINKNPLSSALSLIVSFLLRAGLFLLLDAQFLAGMQVIIYAGAIMVLFLDREGRMIGMVTDRDICIATATKQRIASAIVVGELLSGKLHFCLPEDDLTTALLLMQTEQVRRLPVVNVKGMLEGILSINDIILYAEKSLHGKKKAALSYEEVLKTLKGICAHR